MKRALAVAMLGCALAGCSTEDPTELVVVVYSNIEIPAQIDGVTIRAVRGDDTQEVTAVLGAASDLPKWLVLAHEGGPLGPIEVTVEGTFGDTAVVSQRARTSFIEGQRLVLTMRLLRECGGITCDGDTTCAVGGCRPIDVDPATLVTWPGSVDRVDGAVPPGGCPDGYEDCDGDPANGCETSLRDPASCGTCDTVCPDPPSATPSCSAGTCAFVCEDGRGDCNGNAADGCETDLSSPTSCGGCGTTCAEPAPRCGTNPDTGARICTSACGAAAPVDCAGSCVDTMTAPDHCGTCFFACPDRPNALRACTDGICGFTCMEGYADCDTLTDNGCETSLRTLTTCGACGTSCSLEHATATCATGTCEIATCDEGFADCDGDPATGCEASLTSVANCGGCGMLCELTFATESCAAGTCMLLGCDTDYADCDGNPLTGCEVFTDSLTDCGGCGMACSLANATESCATGTCEVGACDAEYGDCDGAADTGCETSLRTMSDCGSCGGACSLPRAMESCATGTCAIASCDAGFDDCNSDPSDGCETDLSTATDCRTCGTRCMGATPVCDPTSGCVSGCASGEMLCASTCADLQTDANHCGACGSACSTVNATPTCVTGACVLACDMGWADCNGDVTDGCETPLTTSTDCGACGVSCTLANASESCATGTCTLTSCDSGFGNCDTTASNGCEARLDTLTNCGTCGTACSLANATESCATGSCTLESCDAGFGSCDGAASNGCETALTTLSDCGMCGRTCNLTNASESCASGTCALTMCDTGWGNCNSTTSDGCETSLTTTSNCGTCGMGCSLARATESCASGTCEIGMCDTNSGNCDGMAANGCETDVRSDDAHCGMCGNACTFPETDCSSGACDCPSGCDDCIVVGCAGGSACTCDGGCGCALTCAEGCEATCTGSGTVCTIDARVDRNQRLRCLSGASCTIDARGTMDMGTTGTRPAECDGSSTSCDVDCSGVSTDNCQVDCTSGAECILRCHPSNSDCSFNTCSGGSPTSCGGGVYVCNRACP